MRVRLPIVLLLALVPTTVQAQGVPEDLLPAGAQIYVRWDGLDAHKQAYANTALGKMLAGDTGVFLNDVVGRIQEGLGALLTVEQLLGGAPPEKLQQMQADATEAAKLFNVIASNGFILSAEVKSLDPPQGRVTLLLMGAGEKPGPVIGSLRLIAGLAKVPVKEKKIEQRTVYQIETPFIHLSWWIEGKHALVQVSTDTPENLVKELTNPKKENQLSSSALYQRVKGFDKFRTSARAYVDMASLVKLGSTRGGPVAKMLDDLGLTSIKSLVLYSGFDGNAERGLVEMDVPGPRKGLLALAKGKPFRLSDVPALPPDVVSWSMSNLDLAAGYDVIVQTIEAILGLVEPEQVGQVKAAIQQMNAVLGIDLKRDLLEALGDQFVQYTSPDEGPLSLGITVMFKVKDKKKLQESMEQVVKGLAKTVGADVRLKKRTYRGVEVREVHVKEQGFFFVPTWAIHGDWVVISFFPQAVNGYILRATGELDAWKPGPQTAASFEKLPREVTSISWSDPRPSIKQLLSIAPFVAGLANSFNPEPFVEVGTLPNAQEATRFLFPNVSVGTDDGKTVRLDSRASLSLPFEITGVDTYFAAFFLASVARFGF
jgi:hypothetical protein